MQRLGCPNDAPLLAGELDADEYVEAGPHRPKQRCRLARR
jgi:hypothetical protein